MFFRLIHQLSEFRSRYSILSSQIQHDIDDDDNNDDRDVVIVYNDNDVDDDRYVVIDVNNDDRDVVDDNDKKNDVDNVVVDDDNDVIDNTNRLTWFEINGKRNHALIFEKCSAFARHKQQKLTHSCQTPIIISDSQSSYSTIRYHQSGSLSDINATRAPAAIFIRHTHTHTCTYIYLFF